MNRKQRRECGVKGPVKTYTLTDAQIQRMKEETGVEVLSERVD